MKENVIASPARTRAILAAHGVRPKKSLGQNFLVDRRVLERIVAAAELDRETAVLEIGPGVGALTEFLARAAGKVVAVELDRRLLPVLAETLAPYPHVHVVYGDFLDLDLPAFFAEHFAGWAKRAVVANLPYYVTTPILFKLVEAREDVPLCVLMVQKEVAARLAAQPGTKDYGALTIAVQFYAEVDYVMTVPKHAFVPRPQVDSAVVRIRRRPAPLAAVPDERLFFRVVRAAFSQRRKTILNNLAHNLEKGGSRAAAQALLEASGIDPSRRAETLSIAEFVRLTQRLHEWTTR
ncbi:MAG TPA: 16S rRNA (adenine(1518)-N(6)/adenine(1519)-N(6))-dimethyltransferase RsmA [Calditerricola sp.]